VHHRVARVRLETFSTSQEGMQQCQKHAVQSS
jgi:hypothetical protein